MTQNYKQEVNDALIKLLGKPESAEFLKKVAAENAAEEQRVSETIERAKMSYQNRNPERQREIAEKMSEQLKNEEAVQTIENIDAIMNLTPSGIMRFHTQFDKVKMFHIGAQGKSACHIGDLRELRVPKGLATNRKKIIQEEVVTELFGLLDKIEENGGVYSLEQAAELLDHIVDSVYVLFGAAVNFDLPFDVGFDIVQQANMTKVVRPGGAQFDENDKVMKPANFEPPNRKLHQLMIAAYQHATKQDAHQGAIPIPGQE